MIDAGDMTRNEAAYCDLIRKKDAKLRRFLAASSLADQIDAQEWLKYLSEIKNALGNLNNDVSFIATLLVKAYLRERFGISEFDAAGKPQGASGLDIVATTHDGKAIVGEIKTTKPYQLGFGAQQRTMMLKDLDRLAKSAADHRFMFVVDREAFEALCRKNFASRAPGIEIIDLVGQQAFLCPSTIAGA
jgi:hypothetical protein